MANSVPRQSAVRALVRPLQDFFATEAAGGVLLLAAAVCALVWANLPSSGYEEFWARHIDIEALDLELNLRHWVNDGLMALFFLVVGLEIKRELTEGELASPRRAALPIAGAVGGMVLPAAIYLAINAGGPAQRGWGIPMATDIAFAVGVLALLGSRVPAPLKVFLLALAIVDDVGAIAVIAIFYTDDVSVIWLLAAASMVAVAYGAGRAGARSLWLYSALGLVAWYATYQSGVHATIVAVALAFVLPARRPGDDPGSESAIDGLEHRLHPVTGYLVVPLFALANAGVDVGGGAIGDAMSSQVTLGIVAGLLVGKPIGIALAAWLAVRGGVASLPDRVTWAQVIAVGVVAGIGFTVSLFITDLAFSDPAAVANAKIGILGASIMAGIAGLLALRASTRTAHDEAG